MGLGKDAYEAIVVGSGFGGAVSACRLAQAGVDIGLIERAGAFRPIDNPPGSDLLELEQLG